MAPSTAVYTEFLSHRISEIEIVLDSDPEMLNELAEDEIRRCPFLSAFSSDAIIVHRTGKIIFANPTAAEIYGAETAGHLVGMDAIKLVHPNDRTLIFSRRFDLFNGRRLKPIRRKGLRLDGAEFTCESHCTQRILGGMAAIFDIAHLIADRKPA